MLTKVQKTSGLSLSKLQVLGNADLLQHLQKQDYIFLRLFRKIFIHQNLIFILNY